MSSQEAYNYRVVRQFAVMTVVWGIVGMAVGVLIMRMAVPVHGVVRMSVIICRRLIGLTLLTHAQ